MARPQIAAFYRAERAPFLCSRYRQSAKAKFPRRQAENKQHLAGAESPNVSRASLSQQLVDQMISLVEKGHQPPRPIVSAFVDELTGALKDQKLDKSQITAVERSIIEMMQEPFSSNLEPACHLR